MIRDELGWCYPSSWRSIERRLTEAARPRPLSRRRAEEALRRHLFLIGMRGTITVLWANFEDAFLASFTLALEGVRKVLEGRRTHVVSRAIVERECGAISDGEARLYAAARGALRSEYARAEFRTLMAVPSYQWKLRRACPDMASLSIEAEKRLDRRVRRRTLGKFSGLSEARRVEVVKAARRATYHSLHRASGSQALGRAWWEEEPNPAALERISRAWLPLIAGSSKGLWCFWTIGNTVWAVPRLVEGHLGMVSLGARSIRLPAEVMDRVGKSGEVYLSPGRDGVLILRLRSEVEGFMSRLRRMARGRARGRKARARYVAREFAGSIIPVEVRRSHIRVPSRLLEGRTWEVRRPSHGPGRLRA